MSLLGYYLGRSVPGIEKNIDKLVIVVVAVSLLPILIHWLKERRHQMAQEAGLDETAITGTSGSDAAASDAAASDAASR